jgi:hypothetical protein
VRSVRTIDRGEDDSGVDDERHFRWRRVARPRARGGSLA